MGRSGLQDKTRRPARPSTGCCRQPRTRRPRAWSLAEDTLAFLDAALADPRDDSVRECIPDCLPRRSNPHMHLPEAVLAWHRPTGAQPFLDRASVTLGEHVTDTWDPAPHPQGNPVGPGHHLEWS